MKTRFVRGFGLCLAALALVACRDPAAPLEAVLNGAYFLTGVDGGPVPAVLGVSGDVRIVLERDLIIFDGKGSVSRRRVIQHQNVVSGQVTEYSEPFTQDYRVRGDTVEIGVFVPCPHDALCAPNEIGTFAADRLELTSFFGEHQLTFRLGEAHWRAAR